jgi:hypothetical protein
VKNVEDHVEKVPYQQKTMNRSNMGYIHISTEELIFGTVLDKKRIPIPQLLYTQY